MLKGKKVLLGVTGSISAYKAAFLTRLLIKEGAQVKVVMTASAIDFISPLTLATLSKNEVLSDFTSNKDKGTWNNHVDLGLWADYMVIAPATANTLSKMRDGEADNFLLATYLSAKCPVYIAPAMDLDMYKHPSTQENIKALEGYGNKIIYAESGELASGLEGQGRLAEPENIVDYITHDIKKGKPLFGYKILISAGPTHQAIDPVRYIGNRSTGKMGYEIANIAHEMGAEVTLVSGPVNILPKYKEIKLVNVVSAQDMFDAITKVSSEQKAIIMAAAVADYTPLAVASEKIKKKDENLVIELKKTKDILSHLGDNKRDNQLLIGFALETNNEEVNAQKKLEKKKLDFIILNSLQDKGAGFANDTNKITIIDKNNKKVGFELKSKEEVAKDILNYLLQKIKDE